MRLLSVTRQLHQTFSVRSCLQYQRSMVHSINSISSSAGSCLSVRTIIQRQYCASSLMLGLSANDESHLPIATGGGAIVVKGRASKKIPVRRRSAIDSHESVEDADAADPLTTFNKFNSVYLKSKNAHEEKVSRATTYLNNGPDELQLTSSRSGGRSPRKNMADLADQTEGVERRERSQREALQMEAGRHVDDDDNNHTARKSRKQGNNASSSKDNAKAGANIGAKTKNFKESKEFRAKRDGKVMRDDAFVGDNNKKNIDRTRDRDRKTWKKDKEHDRRNRGDMDFKPDVERSFSKSKASSEDNNNNNDYDDDDIDVVVLKKGKPVKANGIAGKDERSTEKYSRKGNLKIDEEKPDKRSYAEKRAELISKMTSDIDNKVMINTKTGGLMELDFIRKPLKIDSKTSLNNLQFTNKFRINRCFPDMSRNDFDSLIAKKQVTVNGAVAEKGSLVRIGDIVRIRGEIAEWKDPSLKDSKFSVDGSRHKYIKMWKPRGVKSFTSDTEFDRDDARNVATLSGCIENLFKGHFHSIGVLELGYTGLIILTNDSDLTNALNVKDLPAKNSYEITVRCQVVETPMIVNDDVESDDSSSGETIGAIRRVYKGVNNSALKRLKAVLEKDYEFEDISIQRSEKFASEIVSSDDTDNAKYKNVKLIMYITEKGNQLPAIKRAFEKEDYKLVSIHRASFAGISLGGLEEGHWKFLSDSEYSILEAYMRRRKHLIKLDKKSGHSSKKLWEQLVEAKGT